MARAKALWQEFTLFFFFLTIGFCCCLPVAMSWDTPPTPSEADFKATGRNKYEVTRAVLFSLAYNRIDALKSHFDPAYWDFLDSWTAEHEPISDECHFPSLGDDVEEVTGDCATHSCSLKVDLICPGEAYHLDVQLSFDPSKSTNPIASIDQICEVRAGVKQCWFSE